MKASTLQRSAVFIVQLSQLYVTTGKTTALTIQTFISRVMTLLFNTLSRFVIAFLPRRNHLISWLYSSSSAQKEEICHYSTFSPALCHEVVGPDSRVLVFLIFSFTTLSSTSVLGSSEVRQSASSTSYVGIFTPRKSRKPCIPLFAGVLPPTKTC